MILSTDAPNEDSDSPDLLPRKLRYSEEVIPLHLDQANENAPQPADGLRPLKVYARLKPLCLTAHDAGRSAAGPSSVAAESADARAWLQATPIEVIQRMRDGASVAYSFDRVFEGSEQQHFFTTVLEPLVADLVSMRVGTGVFMAYGASGAGKSYTMQGIAAQPGVIPRTLDRLYQVLEERRLQHQVQLSYYEVYDNKVCDLLRAARTGRPPPQQVPIIQLGFMPGVLKCHCESAEAARCLYTAAARIRKQAATQVNPQSSRSHAVLTIQLDEVEQGVAKGRSATLSLVDLAGAERCAQTKLGGSKLRESAGINSSLMVLGKCIKALQHNQAIPQRPLGAPGSAVPWVIPVRECTLTTLFRDVLTGRGNLVLSVHVSQHPDDQRMTQSSLAFAAVAAQVQMAVAAPAAVAPAPPAAPSRQVAARQQQADDRVGDRRHVPPSAMPTIAEEQERTETDVNVEGAEACAGASGMADPGRGGAADGPGPDGEDEAEDRMQAPRQLADVAGRAEAGRVCEGPSLLLSMAPLGDESTGDDTCEEGAAEVSAAQLIKVLQAQVQQLQQQLAAEGVTRAAAAAEGEAQAARGRAELERVQRTVSQLEEQLAASQRQLEQERVRNKVLARKVQDALAAAIGCPPHQQQHLAAAGASATAEGGEPMALDGEERDQDEDDSDDDDDCDTLSGGTMPGTVYKDARAPLMAIQENGQRGARWPRQAGTHGCPGNTEEPSPGARSGQLQDAPSAAKAEEMEPTEEAETDGTEEDETEVEETQEGRQEDSVLRSPTYGRRKAAKQVTNVRPGKRRRGSSGCVNEANNDRPQQQEA